MCDETLKVSGSECVNVTVTPVTEQPVEETVIEVSADELLNKFSDKPITEDPEKAKGRLKGLIKYLKSSRFEKKVNSEAYKTGIPPRQIAKGIVAKAFGIIGDILGIAVNTVSCTLNGLIDLLSGILHKGVDIITRVVNGVCRIVTFNQSAGAF